MICSYCSAEMPDISAFCPACGRSIAAAPEPAQAAGSGDRVLAALAYVALLPAALFLTLPSFRTNRFLRFHSWQSVLFFGLTLALAGLTRLLFSLLSIVPGIGFPFAVLMAGLVTLALVMTWCVVVIMALRGKHYELPWLGRWAEMFAR